MNAVAREVEALPSNSAANAGMTIIPLPVPEEVHGMTARMASGDEDAFTLFHARYCDRLFRYLFVLCRVDEQLARDLLQATLLKVVRSIRVFDDSGAFWNWLAAIARHNFLDHVRKVRRVPVLHSISPSESASLSAPQEPEAETSLLAALEQALIELPADERDLVEAFYFQSGSYQSLALEQATSSKAIESRLARVRQKLRHAITRHLRYENS